MDGPKDSVKKDPGMAAGHRVTERLEPSSRIGKALENTASFFFFSDLQEL